MKKILVMGPQGAGKGTQATLISRDTGLPHISTGDLFREAMNNETELGQKAKEYINKGELVPDEIVIGMLKERLAFDDCKEGWILDGYPRNIVQAEFLDKITEVTHLVALDLDDEAAVKRIGGRRTCRKCGAIFHLVTLKPKVEGVCDKCGGELYVRDDDKPDSIKERLKIYHSNTAPIVEHYREKGVSIGEFDGSGVIEDIHKGVMGFLG